MTASRWDNRERARDRRLYWLELPVRARKTGQRLPGHISGQILDRRTPPAGTAFQVRLLGGKQILETTSDSRGQFGFDNLDSGVIRWR